MRVAICSVGSELLSGDVADTNAAWMAQRILESGCAMAATLIMGDDRRQLVEAFRWLADRADVLVIGGGLGPTADDLTRDAVADFAGVALERRSELTDHLDDVYRRLERDMPPDALHQADIPATAQFHAPEGTAAGFSLDVDHAGRSVRVHVLPGVPWEYRGLAEHVVLPDLVERSGGEARITRTLHVAGLGESGVGQLLRPMADRLEAARERPADPEHGIELGFLANAGEVLVKVSATGSSPGAARDRAAPVVDEASALLGDAVTSVDERRLEDEVAQLLETLGATVGTAEGATAGRLAASLSSVTGAASYLRGGYVTYSDETLEELLGTEAGLVSGHGPVSRPVVEAMARAAQQRCRADFGVAVAAVAEEAEVKQDGASLGTAIWAIADPDGSVEVAERHIPASDRDIIQVRGAAFALESLRRHLVARAGAGEPVAQVTP